MIMMHLWKKSLMLWKQLNQVQTDRFVSSYEKTRTNSYVRKILDYGPEFFNKDPFFISYLKFKSSETI